MRRIAFLVLACALPVAAGEPSLDDWQITRQEWTGKLGPESSVAIVNPHGDLRVRAGDAGEVSSLAVIQRHRDDPRQAAVATEEGEDGMRLEVRYPEAAAGEPLEIPEAWRKRRVDLTVFVPKEASVSARTRTGLLELKGLAGDVEAESDRGDLRLRTAGSVRARTVYGEIFAQLRRTDGPGVSRLETLTGDIRVELPRGGRADVTLETRGEITTDYSIEIHRREGSQLKEGRATIGEAGLQLQLKSHSGAIGLIESTVPEQTSEQPAG